MPDNCVTSVSSALVLVFQMFVEFLTPHDADLLGVCFSLINPAYSCTMYRMLIPQVGPRVLRKSWCEKNEIVAQYNCSVELASTSFAYFDTHSTVVFIRSVQQSTKHNPRCNQKQSQLNFE